MKKFVIGSIVIIAFFIIGLTTLEKEQSANIVIETELPTVGSSEKFQKILQQISEKQNQFARYGDTAVMEAATEKSAADSAAPSSSGDYSTTNVQVDGVDEADRIKNDGTYIYHLGNEQFTISKVNPVSDMQIVFSEKYNHNEFYPHEMYVDDQYLVLIGGRPAYDSKGNYHKEFTKIKIYQLNDRSNLELVKESEVEGYYSSSRKIGSALYVVTNKHLPYYMLNDERYKEDTKTLIEEMKPTYRDSALSEEPQVIDWDEVKYFPGSTEGNYLFVSGLDLADLEKPIAVNSYLGAGQTIYASHQHLYITRTEYQFEKPTTTMEKVAELVFNPPTKQDTLIYKFKLDQGAVTFLTEGKVEGTLLNQFSMDEHNNHFRIATTKGDMWSETNPSENNLFVLDENLQVVGSITGIAPGERIFSARFMGDRGYIVTFKQVDPLFVLDLKDPKNPTILGELKIPGFSDYLHPYDENHIIGFGKDTMENNTGGALVQGFKMALFDITDVNHPKEKFVEIIGDRGTHSELLYNHKALLFSKEKNIIGFPIEVYETKQNEHYGDFSFQGAYVYGLDLTDGFQLKQRISHYDTGEISEKHWDYNKHVSRLLFIGDSLYTLSNYKIESHDLSSFEKQGQLIIEK